MFYGYTEIDITVLFTLDGNDKGLHGYSNTDVRKYCFSQIESLTDGTVWTRTLLMHPAWTFFKNRVNKIGVQGRVSLWTSPLNPRPCHVGWPQDKAAQGEHITQIRLSTAAISETMQEPGRSLSALRQCRSLGGVWVLWVHVVYCLCSFTWAVVMHIHLSVNWHANKLLLLLMWMCIEFT